MLELQTELEQSPSKLVNDLFNALRPLAVTFFVLCNISILRIEAICSIDAISQSHSEKKIR